MRAAHVEVGVLGGVLLVVEVVEQPHDAPLLDLGRVLVAEAAGVGAHGLLDGPAVLAQGVALRELEEQGLGLGAGDGFVIGCTPGADEDTRAGGVR